LQLDPGFDRSVTVVELPLPETRYPDAPARAALYQRVIGDARSLPGIETIAAASDLPFGGWAGTALIRADDQESADNRTALLGIQRTYGPYFQAIGQSLLEGRDFTLQDDDQSVPVAILSERGASLFFPDGDAVGEVVRFPEISADTLVTIVGIVANTKRRGLTNESSLEVYVPAAQTGWPEMNLLVKSRPGVNVVGGIRSVIRGVDSELTTDQARTLGEVVDRSLVMQKVSSSLAGIFAIFALLMAAVGMYGVIAYSVSQRTQEIGVRIAMGAHSRDVFKLVIGQMLVLALVGSVIGLAGAAGLSRLMVSLLYGFQLNDLAIFALGVVMAVVIALASSFFPARRASRVDPIAALRVE
jgi:putative ABC transport system permease protein